MHSRFALLLVTCLTGLAYVKPTAAQTPLSLLYSLINPDNVVVEPPATTVWL